jgi:hypothetical protein
MKKWEYFCDYSYYELFTVRPLEEKRWGYGYHINTRSEAKELCDLLNEQEKRIACLEESLVACNHIIIDLTKALPTRYETEAKESTLDPNPRPAPSGNQPAAEGAD